MASSCCRVFQGYNRMQHLSFFIPKAEQSVCVCVSLGNLHTLNMECGDLIEK